MRFLILGPLEVRDGERLVALGGPQQRALLALLLARPGRVVSIDQITEQLWGASAPSAARSLAQGCVAGLRRALTTGRDGVLLTRAPGYVLSLAPGALDLDRFDELVKDATQLAETGARERAAAMLREALALWRGPAFDGIDLDPCRSEAARLEEHRLAVVEQRVAIELRLGRHAELIAELQALTADHPLRERFWAQLITALHRSDRQADALEAYRTVRATLVGELGVEPGPALRQAHQDVLSGAPAAVPAQLPTSASAFTGREHDLLRLDEVLGDSGGAPSIAVICGTAGVGKTALAVRWAHRVRDHFDGGQLYADLRGYAAAPRLRPIEVLTGFLRALDVPVERIPADQEQASALYRTILADRRILVVLDNASSADQVRPLLPGGRPGLVLVTSRDKLGGLVAREGAAHLTLDVLSPAEARALLETVLGADRVAGEPAAVAELAARCAYLPLALRIAAANLTLYPRRTVADQVAEMDALSPLGALAVGSDEQHAVRASYNLSYSGLATPARRLFRLLGIAPSADHTADDATAVLGDTSPREAAGLLRHLTDAHLLDEHARGRYVSHDLLRLYAMERADDEDPPDRRRAAIGRLYDGYLRRARAAADMLYPHMLRLPNATTVPATGRHTYPDETAALAWLEAERHNLVIAIRYAAAHGPRRAGWQLADTLRGYFHLRRYAADWFTAADAALLAARHENDAAAEVAARHSLGTAYRSIGEHGEALRQYHEALRLARVAGWPQSEATTLGNLGIVSRKIGRLPAAVRWLEEALAIDRRLGRRAGEANNLSLLAEAYLEMGRLDDAFRHFAAGLELSRAVGSLHGEALALTGLGRAGLELGRPDEAWDHLIAAKDRYLRVGDRDGTAMTDCYLAWLECDRGRPGPARAQALGALETARLIGDRQTEAIALNVAGLADRLLGRHRNAMEKHRAARDAALATASRRLEGDALVGLAAAGLRLGRHDEARSYAREALELARQDGYEVLVGDAHAMLAEIHHARRDGQAARHTDQAEESRRRTGHHPAA